MGYVGKGLDLLYGGSGYVEACRFAGDSMHVLAVTALAGAGVVEAAVDSPRKTVIAVGLAAASGLLELGAWANQQNIEREEHYSDESSAA
ncbi:MAG TPA: hypothetical protein VLE51_01855 [Candidatus Saccharimonadales bacterium]|nr:hypothetical protein [Candidatus Saccharimonadales bacterium]